MKKTLIAVAVCAVAGAASAANVEVYGVVDTGFTYTHHHDTDSLEMTSGNYAGPRFGLRGTEDLGESLKIGFILESGFNSDTGTMAKDNTIFNRESQVYLTGEWGTVGFGRFGGFTSGSSSMSWYWDMEPFETGYYDAGTQATTLGAWDLHSNAMYYVSPTFAGAKFGLQYSMTGSYDTEAAKWNDRDHWLNAAIRWDAQTLHVLAGVEATLYGDKPDGVAQNYDDTINGKIAVTWDAMPDLRLYVGASAYRNARYVSDRSYDYREIALDETHSSKGLNGYSANVGVRYSIGSADLMAQVQYLGGKNKAPEAGSETDKFSLLVSSIGCHYHFSDRTMGYAIASYRDGSDLLADSATYLHLGVTHYF